MKKIWIKKIKLPFGDYMKCDQCGMDWNIYIVFELFGHNYAMCPDCFEEYKALINKISSQL